MKNKEEVQHKADKQLYCFRFKNKKFQVRQKLIIQFLLAYIISSWESVAIIKIGRKLILFLNKVLEGNPELPFEDFM